MKTCTKCNKIQKLSEYNFRNINKGTRHAICKTCKQKWHVDAMQNTNRREKIRIRQRKWQKHLKTLINRYKQIKGCQKCKEKRYYVLEFHHTKDKDETISMLIRKAVSIETLKKEIQKCVILCANCHKEHHHLIRGKS